MHWEETPDHSHWEETIFFSKIEYFLRNLKLKYIITSTTAVVLNLEVLVKRFCKVILSMHLCSIIDQILIPFSTVMCLEHVTFDANLSIDFRFFFCVWFKCRLKVQLYVIRGRTVQWKTLDDLLRLHVCTFYFW